VDFSSLAQHRLSCAHNILHFPRHFLPNHDGFLRWQKQCQLVLHLFRFRRARRAQMAGARSDGQGPRSVNRPAFGPRPVVVSITAAPRFFVGGRLTPESPEYVAWAASHTTQTNDYGQQAYTGRYWPAVGTYAQPHYSGLLGLGSSFVSTEASGMVPTASALSALKPNTYRLRTVPPNYSGANRSGPFTNTLDMVGHEAPPSSRKPVDAFQQGNAQTPMLKDLEGLPPLQ